MVPVLYAKKQLAILRPTQVQERLVDPGIQPQIIRFQSSKYLLITAAEIYVPAASDISSIGRRQLAPFIEGVQQVLTKGPGVNPEAYGLGSR